MRGHNEWQEEEKWLGEWDDRVEYLFVAALLNSNQRLSWPTLKGYDSLLAESCVKAKLWAEPV